VTVEVGGIAVGAVCSIGSIRSIGAIHTTKVDSSHGLFTLEIFVRIHGTFWDRLS